MNAFVLPDHPVTLVDTGTWHETSIAQMEQALADAGIQWANLEQIVVTHMHTDHAGGVPTIQAKVAADVPIYVHARARPALEGGRAEFERVAAFYDAWLRACGANSAAMRSRHYHETLWHNVRYLADGDEVNAGGRDWHVVYVPGHSQTDIVLWHPGSGDALVGDHLLPDISANALVEPPAPEDPQRPRTLLQYRASMERTKALPLRRVYPGHGDLFCGHAALVEERFAEQAQRCEVILEHLRRGRRTIAEISADMFPRLHGSGVFLGLSEVFGHMDLLLADGRAITTEDDHGVLHFAPA